MMMIAMDVEAARRNALMEGKRFSVLAKRLEGFFIVSRKGPGLVCEPHHLVWLPATKRRGGWFTMVVND